MTGAGTPPRYCRSYVEKGWVRGKMRELGMTYFLAADTKSPVVKVTSRSYDHVTLNITDNESGTAGWTATLDGQFVLFEQQKNPSILTCDLRTTPVKKQNRKRPLCVKVWDNCGNQQKYSTSINY